jgi:hypothetical protein
MALKLLFDGEGVSNSLLMNSTTISVDEKSTGI